MLPTSDLLLMHSRDSEVIRLKSSINRLFTTAFSPMKSEAHVNNI
jgi:hypothetical protein